MPLLDTDHDLLLTDPALRWCLDVDTAGYAERCRGWLASTLAFQAEEQGVWLTSGTGPRRAIGWLSAVSMDDAAAAESTAAESTLAAPPPVSADDEDLPFSEDEARLDALLDELTKIAGEDAVERYFAYAEAVEGLQPDLACHSLSGLAAATPAAAAPLIELALAEVRKSPESVGLFVETADPALAVALAAAGGEPGGQVFSADVVVRSFWWPVA